MTIEEMPWFQIPVWIILIFLLIFAVSFVGRLIGWMHVISEDIINLVDRLLHRNEDGDES